MSEQTINTETEVAEQIAALQTQLDAADDAIGAVAIGWRQAAADPKAVERAAERLSLIEHRRELLRTALAEAQQVLVGLRESGNAARVAAVIADARARVKAGIEERTRLARELAETVDRVASLVQRLYDQGKELAGVFGGGDTPFQVSGVGVSEAATCVNTEDLHFIVNQVLAVRLGRTLWSEETNLDSLGIQVADRIERRECGPLQASFERGVLARSGALMEQA